jgi:hypothetical protein
MTFLANNNKLTMVFNVPINETVARERIKQYFIQANYKILSSENKVLQFQRFQQVNFGGKNLLKTFFLGDLSTNTVDSYSTATLEIYNNKDFVSVKITLEKVKTLSYFISEEILQNEMECFKKALFDNVYLSVKIDHEPRKLFFSNLNYLLLQIFYVVILIVAIWVIFINLYETVKVNKEIAILIAIILALGLVVGVNKLFFVWRKRRIQRKISSVQ